MNSQVLVMNVDRYKRGYDGSNDMSLRGYAYEGAEIIEIVHDGVELLVVGRESYFDSRGLRTRKKTDTPAPNVVEIGHIPWKWIEDIDPHGDEYSGKPIFFVKHRSPGWRPYDYLDFREGTPVPIGPNKRDYFAETTIPRVWPRPIRDWFDFYRKHFKYSRIEKRNTRRFKKGFTSRPRG